VHLGAEVTGVADAVGVVVCLPGIVCARAEVTHVADAIVILVAL